MGSGPATGAVAGGESEAWARWVWIPGLPVRSRATPFRFLLGLSQAADPTSHPCPVASPPEGGHRRSRPLDPACWSPSLRGL